MAKEGMQKQKCYFKHSKKTCLILSSSRACSPRLPSKQALQSVKVWMSFEREIAAMMYVAAASQNNVQKDNNMQCYGEFFYLNYGR